MSRPKVLIVGCGAVGLSQGYHLSAGADITYLVRPGRKSAFAAPKHLYSYKEDELHTFASYRVIESVAEVTGETFVLVFDTLDGHTARSEGGVATLTAEGDLLNEPQNKECFLVYDAVGLDMDEHYLRLTRIAPSRLLLAFSMLAHQRTPAISVPASATKELVAKADILYVSSPPNTGLLVFNTQPALRKKLEALYNANGTLVIGSMPAFVTPWAPLLMMLHLMTWDVNGWGPFSQLVENAPLWTLMLRAQSEMLNLPRFGWTGWVLSWVLGGWATRQIHEPVAEGAKPLAYEEFNAFHHGEKVARQDCEALEHVLREGERAGRKMVALREIVARARAKHA
ncbi:ketopantoate reductase ApbA/PanE domain protein [Didymella exigua CBS 183.55]|uniref:Ketopantoate reductase ApbA/PanE domain protein n=1 Tax=Didymella exigua CBS 183.55 TaxID=1150837 RepID=A0A6A5S4H2_9PLEO|nr:ketopantoate reductase ApbA/PanE domain protein [Didymella exigua CBS 183.55]KAF1932407.1 ketopantoate reductase ApbA/PanE domain protein [Didymella exigua CBS 183.55]